MPEKKFKVLLDVLEEIEKLQPESILDIGTSFGDYGGLLKEIMCNNQNQISRVEGLAINKKGIDPLHQHAYHSVYEGELHHCMEGKESYEVVLMLNVLEHVTKEAGIELVEYLLTRTKKALVLSTPLYPETKKEDFTNEEPLSRWYQLDFCEFDFDYKLVRTGRNGHQIFVLYPSVKKEGKGEVKHVLPDKIVDRERLTVGYFLPHKNLTGGMKMLLQQMIHLRRRGHKIIAFYRSDKDKSALPSWMKVEVDEDIVVPENQSYLAHLSKCDVGVVGWFYNMEEFSNAGIPMVYWEQGHEFLFGENLSRTTRAYLNHCYKQPVSLASVSPVIAKILRARFGRESHVITNGIDTEFYYPDSPPDTNTILLVGNPNLLFKGFDVAIQTLVRVWRSGHRFKVRWACQSMPSLGNVPFPFPIDYVVMPEQEELAKCYREADIFLFTSWYEGFGMPPLEAMASGVPVVTTACGGVEVYAENEKNALLAAPGDVEKLTDHIIFLLKDKKARNYYSQKGRETALKFSFKEASMNLEGYLIKLVAGEESG
ncbi:glycosyltransferase [Halobacillus yeomjeoni]|uniref:Glycosyltransferase n=1 Tax=Halobacillus yeomjeoni TaxID=311194 RepID=A0A931HT05_9BACI|nr:glycosyltransferase family 4 protein [Halobacillus yeomjeoni]MBH0228848.1 glycosyltransferase [Halobacillus yeomjeoni]